MTDRDKRIEEIRQRWTAYAGESDAMWLLAEIDRLHAYITNLQDVHEFEKAKLNAEVSQLREERDDFKHGHIMQQKEIKRLREALEWYADKDKHEIKRRVGGDFAPIVLDRGDIARAALRIGEES